jgi:hypothetical protein
MRWIVSGWSLRHNAPIVNDPKKLCRYNAASSCAAKQVCLLAPASAERPHPNIRQSNQDEVAAGNMLKGVSGRILALASTLNLSKSEDAYYDFILQYINDREYSMAVGTRTQKVRE